MAITVENGTGLPNANSYASTAQAAPVHEDRGHEDWESASTEAQEKSLVKATDYIDLKFIFPREKLAANQGLQNPRTDETEVNPAIVKATILLARYALTEDLFETQTSDKLLELTEKLDGVGSETRKYADATNRDRYPFITDILAGIGHPRGLRSTLTSRRLTK